MIVSWMEVAQLNNKLDNILYELIPHENPPFVDKN